LRKWINFTKLTKHQKTDASQVSEEEAEAEEEEVETEEEEEEVEEAETNSEHQEKHHNKEILAVSNNFYYPWKGSANFILSFSLT
jgi:hypothetical protein